MSEPAEPVSMDARFTEMHRMVDTLAAERDEWRSHAQEAGANLDRVAADLHLSERFVTELRRQLDITESRVVRYREALERINGLTLTDAPLAYELADATLHPPEEST